MPLGVDLNIYEIRCKRAVFVSLRIFYDSRCPLCVIEMKALTERDATGQIELEDIWQEGFSERFPTIDPQQANRILHAQDDSGRVLLGLDVTAEAWARVGIRRYRVLRWPVLRSVADIFYRLFARYRYGISRVLTGRARLCPEEGCVTASNPAEPHS